MGTVKLGSTIFRYLVTSFKWRPKGVSSSDCVNLFLASAILTAGSHKYQDWEGGGERTGEQRIDCRPVKPDSTDSKLCNAVLRRYFRPALTGASLTMLLGSATTSSSGRGNLIFWTVPVHVAISMVAADAEESTPWICLAPSARHLKTTLRGLSCTCGQVLTNRRTTRRLHVCHVAVRLYKMQTCTVGFGFPSSLCPASRPHLSCLSCAAAHASSTALPTSASNDRFMFPIDTPMKVNGKVTPVFLWSSAS